MDKDPEAGIGLPINRVFFGKQGGALGFAEPAHVVCGLFRLIVRLYSVGVRSVPSAIWILAVARL